MTEIKKGEPEKVSKMFKMDMRKSKWKEEVQHSLEGRMRERGEVMLGRGRAEGERSIPERDFTGESRGR